MTHFKETQSFRQPWLMAVLALVVGLPLYGLYEQFGVGSPWGDNPLSDQGLLIYAAVTVVFALWLLGMNLETRVEDHAVIVKFHWLWPEKSFPMSEIVEAEARSYRPIREYGGWGVRWGRSGRAFNVSGNQGVELMLANGRRVMIGSQQPEKLHRAVAERLSH